MFDYDTNISPFTWRYGSEEMRQIWSEEHRRRLMRRVWVSLAAAQHLAGLVTADQLEDLRSQEENIDIARAMEVERELHHDVMAEIRVYSEQAPTGGPILHWGATSADIIDNADVLRQKEALQLVLHKLAHLLLAFASQIGIQQICRSWPIHIYSQQSRPHKGTVSQSMLRICRNAIYG